MKRTLEKALGIGIGLAIAALLLAGGFLLFGGIIASAFGVIAGLPLAFPLTTATLCVVIGGLLLWKRFKK